MTLKNIIIQLAILFAGYNVYAYTDVIKSGETNAQAKQKLIQLFTEGGSLDIEEGTWTINMTRSEATINKNISITGANGNEGVFKRGAFDGDSNKTQLIFTGVRFDLANSCDTVILKNLEWNRRGFDCGNYHYPHVDFDNVIFDLTDAPDGYVDKMVLKFFNGFSGSMKNCSFIDFGSAAMPVNRRIDENTPPVTTRGKLIIDQCFFEPKDSYKVSGSSALPHDAGNDEYPIQWDHGGSEYKNSLFIDCRIGASKGENFKILNNIFELEQRTKDAIHVEEFSTNVLIKGNTFKVIGAKHNELITVGAQQSSYNIDIIGNTVEQTNWTGKFVTGAGNSDIFIDSNTIQNAVPGTDYVGFWSCNNINIQVKPGQTGLGPDNVSVDASICSEVIKEGTFVVKWSADQYLKSTGNKIAFVTLSHAPLSAEFQWEIKKHFYMGRFNYYSFKNVGTGKYLQVAKGPMGRDQVPANYNTPFEYFGKPVVATTMLDFDDNDRVPGFGIFEKNGKYTLMPGGNERRSQIIKDGDDVVLYVVESEETSTYEWSFLSLQTLLLPDIEFTVQSIGSPVANAKISINGVTQITGADGKYLFENFADNKTYSYTIQKDGYITQTGSLFLLNDTSITIDLEAIPTCNVTFEIKDSVNYIEDATIVFNSEQKLSNSSGIADFKNIETDKQYTYIVSKDGYNTINSSVFIDKDTTLSIIMEYEPVSSSFNIKQRNLEIYPNPADDFIIVNAEENATIKIMDISGKIVLTQNVADTRTHVDISPLSRGIYYIKLREEIVKLIIH